MSDPTIGVKKLFLPTKAWRPDMLRRCPLYGYQVYDLQKFNLAHNNSTLPTAFPSYWLLPECQGQEFKDLFPITQEHDKM
jgi:hypothetical protein